jgi:hypothetical protein
MTVTTKGSYYTTGIKGTTVAPAGGTGAIINVATIESATDKAGGNLLLTSGIGTGTGGSEIQFWTSPTSTTGATDNAVTQKMVITQNGNVGIGTVTPSVKLEVAGIIKTTDTTNATSTTSGSIQGYGAGFQGNAYIGGNVNTAGDINVAGAINYAPDTSSTDAYVITPSPAITSYKVGQEFTFKAVTANTDGATLNVNGLGAKTIVKGVNTALATNDILANMFCKVVYDGTNFVLFNPRTL